jgi:hypothetical protein
MSSVELKEKQNKLTKKKLPRKWARERDEQTPAGLPGSEGVL